ncbi:MAG TPA: hypothetical protein VLI92_00610 [Candidatus Saccharimonadales bacterium]|nr:hypothetical protein [Candidatus Saccharimonadales bacterium]
MLLRVHDNRSKVATLLFMHVQGITNKDERPVFKVLGNRHGTHCSITATRSDMEQIRTILEIQGVEIA